jgi:hypothetical protein
VRFAVVLLVAACGRVGFGAGAGADGGGSNADGSGSAGSDTSAQRDGSLSAAGCFGSETAAPYSADFELGQPTWAMTYGQTPVQTTYTNGVLVVAPGMSNPPKFGGVTSAKDDFRNRRFFVEVTAMVNTATQAMAGFGLESAGNNEPYVWWYQMGGALVAETNVGGVLDTSTLPYDPLAHRWWQLREQAGMVIFEVSADGVGWTMVAQKPTPAFVTNAYLDVFAGTMTSQAGNLGSASFDNVYDCFQP